MFGWRRGAALGSGLLLLPLACGSEVGPAEEAVPLQVVPALFTLEGRPLTPLASGDEVDISLAVQGGQVIYIAAQVDGLEGTQAWIETRLSDPESGRVAAADERTIVMKDVAGREGWKQSDIRSRNQVSHLLVCPNDGLQSIRDEIWQLDLTLAEADRSRPASVTLDVVPVCRHSDSVRQKLCECQCAPSDAQADCE